MLSLIGTHTALACCAVSAAKIRSDRGYVFSDIVTTRPPETEEAKVAVEETLRKFYNEHMHVDEEIRYHWHYRAASS